LAEWSGRVVLHYLPTYSPDCNPVERVWWRLHEAVTRNHRCKTITELLDLTFDWFAPAPTSELKPTCISKRRENEPHFYIWREVFRACPKSRIPCNLGA
jgi:transposase